MNCPYCNTPVSPHARFCTNCGSQIPAPQTQSVQHLGNDIVLLLSYIGWQYITYIAYVFINSVVRKKLLGNYEDLGRFYRITDWIISGIDVILILLISILLKNKLAKTLCFIFLALRILIVVYYQFFND
jgi:hypothetical protein